MSTEHVTTNTGPPKAIDLLKQQKLLRNVADEVIEETSRHIRYRRFSKREFVVHKGDAGSSLLMLMSGRLQVIALSEDGREVGLNFVEPGDYFGELSIIDGGPRSALSRPYCNGCAAPSARPPITGRCWASPVRIRECIRCLKRRCERAPGTC
jgi:hypothetical protein